MTPLVVKIIQCIGELAHNADGIFDRPIFPGRPLGQIAAIDQLRDDVRMARFCFPDIVNRDDGGMVEIGQDSGLHHPSIHLRGVFELGQQLQCNKAFKYFVLRSKDDTKGPLPEFL